MDSEACHNSRLAQSLETSTSLTFNDTCAISSGGKCSIAATVLWFLAAVTAFKVQPPKREPVTTQTQDVTYTKTTNPDGTVVVTENVVKGEPVQVDAAACETGEVEAPLDSN